MAASHLDQTEVEQVEERARKWVKEHPTMLAQCPISAHIKSGEHLATAHSLLETSSSLHLRKTGGYSISRLDHISIGVIYITATYLRDHSNEDK